jgi:rubrerythrin
MSMTIKKALEIAVETEQLGEKLYNDMAVKFRNNEQLTEMFDFLAKDEADHEKQFKALLTGFEGKDIEISEEDKQYLEATDLTKYFENMKKVDDNAEPLDVLKLVYNVERGAVLFFTGIRDAVGTSKELDAIINIEKKHMTRVMRYILDDSKFRGMKDNWL